VECSRRNSRYRWVLSAERRQIEEAVLVVRRCGSTGSGCRCCRQARRLVMETETASVSVSRSRSGHGLTLLESANVRILPAAAAVGVEADSVLADTPTATSLSLAPAVYPTNTPANAAVRHPVAATYRTSHPHHRYHYHYYYHPTTDFSSAVALPDCVLRGTRKWGFCLYPVSSSSSFLSA
jgi:hypothetical protein